MGVPVSAFFNEGDEPAQTDVQRAAFINFICQARCWAVVMLHSAGIKACGAVNGRISIHPISFPAEIGAECLYERGEVAPLREEQ